MRLSPRLPSENVNVSKASPLKDFVVMFGSVALGLVLLYAVLGFAVDLVAPRISFETEKKLAATIISDHPILKKSKPAPERITELAERIRTSTGMLDHPVDVRVADMSMVNAFALPGGHIVITQGLLDAMEFDNELTFVLGHEMGHIAARDNLRGMGRALVLMVLSQAVLGDTGGLGDTLSNMLVLTDMKFSRNQELRADARGLEAMMAIHGHAGGLRAVFEHLGGKDYGYLTEFTLSHPESQKRIKALEASIDRHGHPVRAPSPSRAD